MLPILAAEPLPIRVMHAMPVIVTRAVAGALRNTEHAFNAANRAADSTTNCAADYSSDRACGTVAFIGTLSRAANDTLSLGDHRHGQNGNNAGDHQMHFLHVESPWIGVAS
jgi:hypothetical protein